MATHSSILAWRIPWRGVWQATVRVTRHVTKSWTQLINYSSDNYRHFKNSICTQLDTLSSFPIYSSFTKNSILLHAVELLIQYLSRCHFHCFYHSCQSQLFLKSALPWLSYFKILVGSFLTSSQEKCKIFLSQMFILKYILPTID